MKLQKLGGYASIVLVCIAIIAIINNLHLHHLHQGLAGKDVFDPVKMLYVYKASTMSFLLADILGIPSVILTLLVVLALEERLRSDAPRLMRLAVIAVSVYFALSITFMIIRFLGFGVLPATNDMSAFRAFLFLNEALDLASVNVLGWGFLLIGWAAIRSRRLPRILCYIIVIFGIVSITVLIFLAMGFILVELIYALLYLIIYIWLGIVLLRRGNAN